MSPRKFIAFDMDGTLLEGRLISFLAEKFDFKDNLDRIQHNSKLLGYQRSQQIASLLKDIHETEIIEVIDGIGIIQNWRVTIDELKSHSHVLGIISDSYTLACDYLAKKMGLDFVVANALVSDKGVLTGEISMPLGWEKIDCKCKQSVCKRYHLERISERFGIPLSNTVAVGDSISDLCMIEHAGLGIALKTSDALLEEKSDAVIEVQDLQKILPFILRDTPRLKHF